MRGIIASGYVKPKALPIFRGYSNSPNATVQIGPEHPNRTVIVGSERYSENLTSMSFNGSPVSLYGHFGIASVPAGTSINVTTNFNSVEHLFVWTIDSAISVDANQSGRWDTYSATGHSLNVPTSPGGHVCAIGRTKYSRGYSWDEPFVMNVSIPSGYETATAATLTGSSGGNQVATMHVDLYEWVGMHCLSFQAA